MRNNEWPPATVTKQINIKQVAALLAGRCIYFEIPNGTTLVELKFEHKEEKDGSGISN